MCKKRLSKCLASSKAKHIVKPRGGERRVGRIGELVEGETAMLDSAGADRLRQEPGVGHTQAHSWS